MRHVDDAHDAEGDGKADGRQQQHGAERDAVPDVLAARSSRRAWSRCRRSRYGRPAPPRPGLAAAPARTGSTSRLPVAASVLIAASFSVIRTVGAEERCGLRQLQRGLHRSDRFPCARASSIAGRALASRDLSTACAASEPLGRIGTRQRGAAGRRLDGAAQRIVDLDLGELALRGLSGRCARDRVGQGEIRRPLRPR